jgi:hypothetical protein
MSLLHGNNVSSSTVLSNSVWVCDSVLLWLNYGVSLYSHSNLSTTPRLGLDYITPFPSGPMIGLLGLRCKITHITCLGLMVFTRPIDCYNYLNWLLSTFILNISPLTSRLSLCLGWITSLLTFLITNKVLPPWHQMRCRADSVQHSDWSPILISSKSRLVQFRTLCYFPLSRFNSHMGNSVIYKARLRYILASSFIEISGKLTVREVAVRKRRLTSSTSNYQVKVVVNSV